MTRSSTLLVASAVATLALPALGGATFINLGPGGATDVSADGSTVVGVAGGAGFSWTAGGGLLPLGGLSADAVNGDGSVIAGVVDVDGLMTAGRWTNGLWTPLGGLGPTGCDAFLSSSYDISGDGSIIVGLGWDGCDAGAFRWTEADGMVALPQMGPFASRANAISANGMVIGGWDEASNGARRAALWDADLNETLLLAGETGNPAGAGEVYGFNSDGSIIVGEAVSSSASTKGPFVWREGSGLSYLGAVAGTAPIVSGAIDTSEDGSVVVGYQRTGSSSFAIYDATIWTEATGLMRISDYLADLGVQVPPTLKLAAAQGISDDGTVIAGWGYEGIIFNQFAWVVTLPGAATCPGDLNGDGIVDGADLGELLGAWGPCTDCPADLNGDGNVDGADLGLQLAAWGACS